MPKQHGKQWLDYTVNRAKRNNLIIIAAIMPVLLIVYSRYLTR